MEKTAVFLCKMHIEIQKKYDILRCVIKKEKAKSAAKEKGSRKERRTIMKVQNIKDVNAFFKMIDTCEGTVELVTGEGDRLNLKSKLSQYVSLANIFSNGDIPEMEIVAHEKDDVEKILHFMMNN